MLFATGRRTVAAWLRAAGVGDDWRPYYYFISTLGRKAEPIAARLLRLVLKHVAAGPRLVFALDDTPTKRYGPHVEGAGIHHNPTPGPADSKYVYWVPRPSQLDPRITLGELPIGIQQLDDRLDGLKLDEIAVLHGCRHAFLALFQSRKLMVDQAVGGIVSIFRVPHAGIKQAITMHLARPGSDYRALLGLPLEQIEGVEVQMMIEEELDVIEQEHTVTAVLVDQLTQQTGSLERAGLGGNRGETGSKHAAHI